MTETERRNARELAERRTRKISRRDFERLLLRVTELEARKSVREAVREGREAVREKRALHVVKG